MSAPDAPRYVESIPTVTAPVKVPEAGPEMSRARFLAGVITGGVLAILTVGLLILGLVVS